MAKNFFALIRQMKGSELKNSLSTLWGPAHTGSFHPVIYQVLAGTLNQAAANGKAEFEVFVVTHPDSIGLEIA